MGGAHRRADRLSRRRHRHRSGGPELRRPYGTGAAVSPSPSISPSKSATVVTVRVYKIKKGDTLSQIAERFGTTVDKILEANPTIDINSLSVGLKVKIPPPE
jgi:membrane-bound lytic murein transglycosylase D